ncbi:uncharacterized protein BO80DRAFT_441954 [Aspergillus ibericus CBS 121593]|uniref:Pyruvate decarboxylase n=1 Tax=Aspergillus ibericus CBS 121593 TaxID=1448316 RepID=A0A395H9Y8_9EURO|nr:hypothetical protein BO80DRAFT_441954 [Aspergillus ibericus CBS 121593]RAL04490.1 hypothetical protein BO80DRAFT_441954 [Aspergillus ibericus CBS 121593]
MAQTQTMLYSQLLEHHRTSNRGHRNHAVPSPGPDEVLVSLKFSGLCHSSLHSWKGNLSTRKRNCVDGHEGTGIITAIGNEVNGLRVGDHVGVQWINKTCGICDADKRSDFASCPHARMTGYSVDGTFDEYCTIQACHAVRIPKQFPLDTVAPIICAGTTCFRAVQESGAEAGDTVAIVGPPGGLGSLTCQYAKARGCRVLAISSGEDSELLYKQKIGVDFYEDYRSPKNVAAEVQGITGGGPDAAILIEGTETLLKSALQYVRPRGTVVVVGLPPGAPVGMDLSNLMSKMAHIKVSPVGGTREQIEEAMHILIKERFYQPCHVLGLDQLPQTLKIMQRDNPKEISPEATLAYGGQLLGEAVIKIPDSEIIPMHQKPVEPPKPQPTFYQKNYNIGTFLAYRMEELGICEYFVVPGDSNLFLLDNLLKNPNLRMVGCCNELNAGYAADGYARLSPTRIAVVVVPYIVGSLSVLNAVSGACSQNIKLIVLAGCPATNLLDSGKFLHHTPTTRNKDQGLQAFQGVTATSVRLESAETAVDVLDETIGKCLDSSLPVYIEVPNDLASAACAHPSPLGRKVGARSDPHMLKEAVDTITDIWNSSHKPVLILGSFARRSLYHDHVELLADKLGCAVLCQPDGRCIKESHPQYCGQFWAGMTNPEGEHFVMDSDLWLVIGGNWSELHTLRADVNQEKHRMISVGKDWVELPDGRCIEPVKIRTLVAHLIQSDMDSKNESVPRPKPVLGCLPPDGPENLQAPVTLKSVMSGIQELIKEYDTLLCDAGESWFVANHILLPPGADCQIQFPYCSIGWALPAGFGAQLGRTRGRSIILIGDGGFQMTAQELSTMIYQKVNPVIFVFNNLGYKIETAVHDGPYNYIANWDYAKLASVLSAKPHSPSHNPYAREAEDELEGNSLMFSMQVRTREDLKLVLNRVDEEPDKLAFIELCIQPDDKTSELEQLGNMVAKQYTKEQSETESPATETDKETKADPKDVPSYYSGISSACFEKSVPKRPNKAPVPLSHEIDGENDHKDLLASRLSITFSSDPKPLPAPDTPEAAPYRACTDHMIQARWTAEKGWESPGLVPYGSLPISPIASTLHYSTQCFEGMKVYRGYDGKLRLFRPTLNCERMLSSAERICLPRFDPHELLLLIHAICAVEAPKWLAEDRAGQCLYIRPAFLGTSEGLGLNTPQEALLYIVLSYALSPSAGPSSTPKALRLWSSTENMVRAWPGGTGHVKVGANYGPSVPAQNKAHKLGYDQVLWLFGQDRQVTESGAANFFVIWETIDGRLQLVTAPLQDQLVLPGVTRRSILELARERLSDGPLQVDTDDGSSQTVDPLEVVEERFTINDIIDAANQGRLREAFSAGTAYFIAPISCIAHGTHEVDIPVDSVPYVSVLRQWLSDIMYGKEKSPWTEVVEEYVA